VRCALIVLGSWCVLAPAPVARAGVDLHAVPPAGIAASDTAALAAVGDVNGDGVPDTAAGLQDDRRTPDVPTLDEIAVVGFGPAPPDAGRPGFSGLVITHLNEPAPNLSREGQAIGGDVTGVGDWDGDGLADVAVSAIGASPRGRGNAGSVYVVLGRRENGTVDVRTDPRVVRIDGARPRRELGATIGPAGDVDGDGRPDLAIALEDERAVIVRGGAPGGTAIDLAHPPAGATIPVRGLDAGPRSADFPRVGATAPAFAPAGDVDGDGRGELLVGLPAADPLGGRGRVLVLRGAGAGATIDARKERLARIAGPESASGFGLDVDTLPDTDGDGHPEWLVGSGAPDGVFAVGGEFPHGAYVVFSRARGEVRPDRPGQPVVSVDARGLGSDAGRAVAGLPDATGDGVPDLLVGLPDADPSCRARAGALALVPGRATPGAVRIAARTPRVDGASVGGAIGSSIALAGGELLLGARPFENAAELTLWQLPVTALAGASPALPRRCLEVTVGKRTRAQLVRGARLRVSVRSDAGDGRAHRVRVYVLVAAGRRVRHGAARTLAFPRAERRRVTLPLPRGAERLLRARGKAYLTVVAEQRVGSGVRATLGGSGGAVLRFPAR
jgi:hypothetical protein